MTALRRALARLAACWLLCTVAGLAAAPIALDPQAFEAELECTCGHGDHAMCPMHHRFSAASRCAMRGLADDGVALLQSALGAPGVVAAPSPAIGAAPTTTVVAPITPSLIRRALPPDSPPPRA